MRDYFNENSYGELTVTGEILNDTTGAGIPNWVTLSETKATWEARALNPNRFMDSTMAATTIDTSGYDRIVVIYAGVEGGGGLNPVASGVGGRHYIVGEKTGLQRGRTQSVGTFYGIGTHCHELGHLIGLRDLRNTNDNDHPRGISEFALMSAGNQGFMDGDYTDPNIGGFHAPTAMTAWSKLILDWADHEEFVEGNVTFPSFDEDDQFCVYFINDSDNDDWEEGEYFIFENRRPEFDNGDRTFSGDMQRGGTLGGLLIFHHRDTGTFTNSLSLEVVEADNSDAVGTGIGAASMAHFYPGTTNNTEFSNTSTPRSADVNGNWSGMDLVNIANNDGVVSAIVDFGEPNAPQDLVMTNPSSNGQHPNLEWDANTETDLDSYDIHRGDQDSPSGSIFWHTVATTSNTSWTDTDITINTSGSATVYYRITAIDILDQESDSSNTVSTNTTIIPKQATDDAEEDSQDIPKTIGLRQNYPNPFNPSTTINYQLPAAGYITLKVYDIYGYSIATLVDATKSAGRHSVIFDGSKLASGVYFVSMKSGNFQQTRKITLIK